MTLSRDPFFNSLHTSVKSASSIGRQAVENAKKGVLSGFRDKLTVVPNSYTKRRWSLSRLADWNFACPPMRTIHKFRSRLLIARTQSVQQHTANMEMAR